MEEGVDCGARRKDPSNWGERYGCAVELQAVDLSHLVGTHAYMLALGYALPIRITSE